jgi:tetratricopeptide (TPR) repeat protein
MNLIKKGKRYVSLFFFMLLLPLSGWGTVHFSFNAACANGLRFIHQLRFIEAEATLASERNNENIAPLLLDDYMDFIRVFINENEEEYTRLYALSSDRIKRFEALPVQSPWRLYGRGEIRLHWGMAAMKFGSYWTAFTLFRNAWSDLQENARLHPGFILTQKSLGLLEAAVGTIPQSYRGFASLLGFSGTISGGLARVERVSRSRPTDPALHLFHHEASLIACWLRMHLAQDPQGAWNMVQAACSQFREYPFATFVRANVAMSSGRNDEAINTLKQRIETGSQAFYYLDFMLGQALMHKLDTTAEIYLRRYLVRFKGQNYLKRAARDLAWVALLKGDMTWYHKYLSLARTMGEEKTDEDRQALRDAWQKHPPDVRLLKARLLCDGGYYARALTELGNNNYSRPDEQTEYHYRRGRILHELKRLPEAESAYLQAISLGKNLERYFASNAALQLGLICESLNRNLEAARYFKMAIDDFPQNKEYRNGIEQKARAGLQRIGQ